MSEWHRTKRLPANELEAVRDVLGGVLSAARFPDPSNVPPGPYASEAHRVTGMEEIESVHQKRRDLFTIFKNIVRIHHEVVISTLLEQLQITLQNAQAPFQVSAIPCHLLSAKAMMTTLSEQ